METPISASLKIERIVILLFIIHSVFSSALNGQLLVDVKSRQIDDGLKDRLVLKVGRDKYGFFYINSESSIQRYDGEQFIEIEMGKLINAKIKPIDINEIVRVDGDIFLKTNTSSKLFFIKASQTFIEEVDLKNEYKVYFDNNRIFLVTKLNSWYEVYEYNRKTNVKKLIAKTKTEPIDIIGVGNTIYFNDSDNVYKLIKSKITNYCKFKGRIKSSNSGLLLFNNQQIFKVGADAKLNLIYESKNNNQKLKRIKNDLSGNAIAFYNDGLINYTDHLLAIVKEKIINYDSTIITYDNKFIDLHSDDITQKVMTVGHQGIYIFSFMQDGAYQVAKKKNLVKTFGEIISGIAVNKDNIVTYVSELEGLYKIDNESKKEKPIFTSYKNVFKRNGKMYFSKYNQKNYSFSYELNETGTIHEIDYEKNIVKSINLPYKVNNLTLFDNKLLAFGKDAQSGVLGSLDLNNINKSVQILYRDENEIYGCNKINNQYWISTTGGIIVCNENFKEIAKFNRHQKNSKRQIDMDYVRLVDTFNNKLIAGSIGGGIYIIDQSKLEIVKQINQKNGLTDNKAIGVLVDNNGYCWIPTWNGLNVIDKNFNVVKVLYQHHGLPDKEFNTKAYCKDKNGILYFGTVNGLIAIDPDKVLKWQLSNGLFMKNITIDYGDKKELVKSLNIKSDADLVKIDFQTPDYYIYKYDVPFIKVSGNKSNYIQINGLSGIIENPKIENSQLSFLTMSSPYRQNAKLCITTNYALYLKILGLLLISGLISYIIILRIKRNETEKTELNKKFAELELTALQSQMNPHFIFNALGAIQYFIQTQNAEKADEYLSDFAQLMRKILESSKSKFITITDEIKMLKLYIGLEQIRFENKFEFEIIEDEDLDEDFKLPPMIVQPFIENSINHGILLLKNQMGKLTIFVKQVTDDNVSIIIEDNGVGRKKAMEMRSKTHKSRGMQIVNERIATFNDNQGFKVISEIQDLYDENNEALGTRVVLNFFRI